MKYEKSCGAVCFIEKEDILKVLIVQHKLGGHWAFPKGHVEQNETELQTAAREVLEETGVEISFIDGFRIENTYNPTKNICKTVVYFVAQSETEKTVPQPEEIRNVYFENVEKAKDILTYEADRKMLAKAIDFYNQQKNQ